MRARASIPESLKDSKRPVDGYGMSHQPSRRERAREAWRRVPLPALVLLALLLAAGPVGLALSRDDPRATRPGNTLGDVARQLGHGAQLTMRTYGHVIDELEDAPRLAAEDAIRQARERLSVGKVSAHHLPGR